MQACSNCNKQFDFDKEGLGSSIGGYVCSDTCARQLSAKRGTHHAIHDKQDVIVDTDAPLSKLRGEKVTKVMLVAMYENHSEVLLFEVVDGEPVGTEDYFNPPEESSMGFRDFNDYDYSLVELPIMITPRLKTEPNRVH